MSPDRISPSTSLIETLRALARDRTKDISRGGNINGGDPPAPAAPPTPIPHSLAELRKKLQNLVGHVDAADALSIAKIREPALREIVLWEFGSDFRKDSQFLPMVDAIGKSLDANPNFQQQFAELIRGLQKG